jgi:hypothetical protein
MSARFIDIHREFLQLIASKEWTKALTMTERAEVIYPDKIHYTSFWKVYFLSC